MVGVHAQAVVGVVAGRCDGGRGFEVFGPMLVLAAAAVVFEGEGGGCHVVIDVGEGEVG